MHKSVHEMSHTKLCMRFFGLVMDNCSRFSGVRTVFHSEAMSSGCEISILTLCRANASLHSDSMSSGCESAFCSKCISKAKPISPLFRLNRSWSPG